MLKLWLSFVIGAVALIGLVFVLTRAQPPRTVSYYLAHPAETVQANAACRQTGEFSDNCGNAEEAKWQLARAVWR
jgi:hypothetical protein